MDATTELNKYTIVIVQSLKEDDLKTGIRAMIFPDPINC